MSAAAALALAAAAGVQVRLEHGRLRWRACGQPPADLLAELRRYREDILLTLETREALRQGETAPTQVAEGCDAFGSPTPEADGQQALAGLLPMWLQRPPAWSDPASTPPLGAWCSCCGRFTRSGGRWWREAEAPRGWRCITCHPMPARLPAVEVQT